MPIFLLLAVAVDGGGSPLWTGSLWIWRDQITTTIVGKKGLKPSFILAVVTGCPQVEGLPQSLPRLHSVPGSTSTQGCIPCFPLQTPFSLPSTGLADSPSSPSTGRPLRVGLCGAWLTPDQLRPGACLVPLQEVPAADSSLWAELFLKQYQLWTTYCLQVCK